MTTHADSFEVFTVAFLTDVDRRLLLAFKVILDLIQGNPLASKLWLFADVALPGTKGFHARYAQECTAIVL